MNTNPLHSKYDNIWTETLCNLQQLHLNYSNVQCPSVWWWNTEEAYFILMKMISCWYKVIVGGGKEQRGGVYMEWEMRETWRWKGWAGITEWIQIEREGEDESIWGHDTQALCWCSVNWQWGEELVTRILNYVLDYQFCDTEVSHFVVSIYFQPITFTR